MVFGDLKYVKIPSPSVVLNKCRRNLWDFDCLLETVYFLGVKCLFAEFVGEFGCLVGSFVEQVGGFIFEIVHETLCFLFYFLGLTCKILFCVFHNFFLFGFVDVKRIGRDSG